MDGFLLAHFPVSCSTEAECEDYLIQLRWADGFHCPRCDHEFFYKIGTRKLYECRECRTQVSQLCIGPNYQIRRKTPCFSHGDKRHFALHPFRDVKSKFLNSLFKTC
jgi:transposase-like protein